FCGIWYQVEEVPNTYVDVKQCIRLNYTWDGIQFDVVSEGLDEDGQLVDQFTSISQVQPQGQTHSRPYLQIRSPNVPPVPCHIINTNYISFACIYSCFEFIGLKVEIYSVLSRTPKAANSSLAACHGSFQELDIDLESLQLVDQGDECWYRDASQSEALKTRRLTITQDSDSAVSDR
ncbi:hypothetical protein OTU49_013430, partial [Cherax quadricarinatus]